MNYSSQDDANPAVLAASWTLVVAFGLLSLGTLSAFVLALRLRRPVRASFFAAASIASATRATFHALLTSQNNNSTAMPDVSLMHAALVVPEASLYLASALLLWAVLRTAHDDGGGEGDPAQLSLYYGRFRRGDSIRRMRAQLLGGPTSETDAPGAAQWSWTSTRIARRTRRVLPFVLGAVALVGLTVAAGLACAAASSSPDAWRAAAPIIRGCLAWALIAVALVSSATHRSAATSLVIASFFTLPKGVLGSLDWLYLWTETASVRMSWIVWAFLVVTEFLPLVSALAALLVGDIRLLRIRREATQPLLTSSSSYDSAVQWP